MASIKRRGGSFLIRCYDGYDQNGKQIERTMTWKIPAGMTDIKAEKEARHQAISATCLTRTFAFERFCKTIY